MRKQQGRGHTIFQGEPFSIFARIVCFFTYVSSFTTFDIKSCESGGRSPHTPPTGCTPLCGRVMDTLYMYYASYNTINEMTHHILQRGKKEMKTLAVSLLSEPEWIYKHNKKENGMDI